MTRVFRELTPIRTKTVKRPKTQGRIVITYEFDVPRDLIHPGGDAVDVVRPVLDAGATAETIMPVLESLGISVISSRVEITK
jgi:hypothetical protein